MNSCSYSAGLRFGTDAETLMALPIGSVSIETGLAVVTVPRGRGPAAGRQVTVIVVSAELALQY